MCIHRTRATVDQITEGPSCRTSVDTQSTDCTWLPHLCYLRSTLPYTIHWSSATDRTRVCVYCHEDWKSGYQVVCRLWSTKLFIYFCEVPWACPGGTDKALYKRPLLLLFVIIIIIIIIVLLLLSAASCPLSCGVPRFLHCAREATAILHPASFCLSSVFCWWHTGVLHRSVSASHSAINTIDICIRDVNKMLDTEKQWKFDIAPYTHRRVF